MGQSSYIELSFSDELISAVGRLFLTASTTDAAIALQLARILCHPNKIDPTIVIATNRANLKVRLRQIQTVAILKIQEPHRSKIIRLCDKVRDAFERRNDIAHLLAQGQEDPNKIKLQPLVLEKQKLAEPKIYDTKQIEEFGHKIFRAVSDLDDALTNAGVLTLTESNPRDPQEQDN